MGPGEADFARIVDSRFSAEAAGECRRRRARGARGECGKHSGQRSFGSNSFTSLRDYSIESRSSGARRRDFRMPFQPPAGITRRDDNKTWVNRSRNNGYASGPFLASETSFPVMIDRGGRKYRDRRWSFRVSKTIVGDLAQAFRFALSREFKSGKAEHLGFGRSGQRESSFPKFGGRFFGNGKVTVSGDGTVASG